MISGTSTNQKLLQKMKKLPFTGIGKYTSIKRSRLINLTSLLKIRKTCMLIDMEIPSDRDTSVKVAEKLSKYKNLKIEITKMWGLKTITVPVVIGALGVVKKGIEEHIDKIPGKINSTELQKIAQLGSSHILRKVLPIE